MRKVEIKKKIPFCKFKNKREVASVCFVGNIATWYPSEVISLLLATFVAVIFYLLDFVGFKCLYLQWYFYILTHCVYIDFCGS